MPAHDLPAGPNLEQYRKQATDVVKAFRAWPTFRQQSESAGARVPPTVWKMAEDAIVPINADRVSICRGTSL